MQWKLRPLFSWRDKEKPQSYWGGSWGPPVDAENHTEPMHPELGIWNLQLSPRTYSIQGTEKRREICLLLPSSCPQFPFRASHWPEPAKSLLTGEPGRAAVITVPRTEQEKGGNGLRCSPGTDSKVKILKLLLGNGEVSLFQTFLTKQHIQKEQGKEHYEQVWEAVTYRFEIPGWDGWMMQGWGRGAGCSMRCCLSVCQLHRGTAPREAHGSGNLLVQEHRPSQVHSAPMSQRGLAPQSREWLTWGVSSLVQVRIHITQSSLSVWLFHQEVLKTRQKRQIDHQSQKDPVTLPGPTPFPILTSCSKWRSWGPGLKQAWP